MNSNTCLKPHKNTLTTPQSTTKIKQQAGENMRNKKPLEIQIEELRAEFSKPHTEAEYELLHKKHKRLLAIDFFRGIAFPLIALLLSLTALAMQLLLL